jgi:tRNA(Met) cytidine acetyltransferase
MRIAIHPAVRGRGLGTRLIDAVAAQSIADRWDWIGSSFGATLDLLRFWERSACLPVRVGLTREASSGTHSVLVLRPLTARSRALFRLARARFSEHLTHLFADPLRELDPEIARHLLYCGDAAQDAQRHRLGELLDDRDWLDLRAFAFARRGFEDSLVPIWKLIGVALADPHVVDRLGPTDWALLVARVLQKRSWQEVAAIACVPGRAQVIEALRRSCRRLVTYYQDETRSSVDPGSGTRMT